jgi:hypothetical protein
MSRSPKSICSLQCSRLELASFGLNHFILYTPQPGYFTARLRVPEWVAIGLSDYPCIPFQAHRRSGPDNQLIVMASALSDPTVQRYVDEKSAQLYGVALRHQDAALRLCS